jgi:hypothetical protein
MGAAACQLDNPDLARLSARGVELTAFVGVLVGGDLSTPLFAVEPVEGCRPLQLEVTSDRGVVVPITKKRQQAGLSAGGVRGGASRSAGSLQRSSRLD